MSFQGRGSEAYASLASWEIHLSQECWYRDTQAYSSLSKAACDNKSRTSAGVLPSGPRGTRTVQMSPRMAPHVSNNHTKAESDFQAGNSHPHETVQLKIKLYMSCLLWLYEKRIIKRCSREVQGFALLKSK